MLKIFAALVSTVMLTGAVATASEVMLPPPATKTAFGDADALAEAKKYDMVCNEWSTPTVERISVKFRYSYEGPTAPQREQGYFIVTCAAGAYNENSVLLREDTDAGVLRPVSFAVPMTNKKGKIVGFTADIVTGYLSFDPKTNQLTTFSKGRGIGDMFVSGTYQIYETDVILREYTIDNVAGDSVVVPPVYKSTEKIDR